MDITIRKNENCVIGLPRCDFVFSSTRSCFIAYGFIESTLEMSLLRKLLEEREMQPIEAAGNLAPGQSAYCAKICSKIITAQFCIVLLNNDESQGTEIPNANVNLEYGLMLGFNKYVIPFQRANQKLPFNVAGLDTIKYDNKNFEQLAATAIEQAISTTTQTTTPIIPIDQLINTFLLKRHALVASLMDQGERNLHDLGHPLGFTLLSDFSGMRIIYFGNFTALRPEAVLWRIKTLTIIFKERIDSIEERVKFGLIPNEQLEFFREVLTKIQVWILLTNQEEQVLVTNESKKLNIDIEVFSLDEISHELSTNQY